MNAANGAAVHDPQALLLDGQMSLGRSPMRHGEMKAIARRLAFDADKVTEQGGSMQTIGLIGGMSWESTQTYYRLINQQVRQRLGGLHSARLVLYSVDFAEIETLQHRGDWDATAEILGSAARAVEAAGADFLVLCTNTMHKVAPQIESAVAVPLLHIADATASVLASDGVTCVGLLGTRFTMEQAFYRERLEARGIEVLVPDAAQREVIHAVIYQELCQGVIKPESKVAYLGVVDSLAQ